MNEIYLNGRPAVDWEIPIIERARRCERSRDLEQLAGILTADARPERPVPERGRRVADISLPVLS